MGSIMTALLLLAGSALSLSAQQLAGTLADRVTQQRLPHGMVQVVRADSTVRSSVFSDEQGRFSFNLPDLAADGYLFVMLTGYRTQRLPLAEVADRVSIVILLEPDPLRMRSLPVEASARNRDLERSGFYDRKRGGIGRFVTRAELDEGRFSRESRLVDVLKLVPGVVFTLDHFGDSQVFLRAPASSMAEGRCPAQVFVDGLSMGDMLPQLGRHDVEALEVYVGPSQVPAQYSRLGAMCGAVLVWTRTGNSR